MCGTQETFHLMAVVKKNGCFNYSKYGDLILEDLLAVAATY